MASTKLENGKLYFDTERKEIVEFGYMGQTGYAIVYEPGESGGGMQSSWCVEPEKLEAITNAHKIKRA